MKHWLACSAHQPPLVEMVLHEAQELGRRLQSLGQIDVLLVTARHHHDLHLAGAGIGVRCCRRQIIRERDAADGVAEREGDDLGGIERLVKDAIALDRAGVFALVLEGVPREVAAMITHEVSTPTIGIGAGPECDGQVLVFHDIMNLTFTPAAKFVRRYADASSLISNAVHQFISDVESGSYPSDEESYHLPKETKAEFEAILRRKQLKAYSR